MRAELNEGLASKGVKLTINDFIVKASALALADYPAANAAWNIDSMVMFGNVDMAVAVATPGGLITPIVRNADQKSLVQKIQLYQTEESQSETSSRPLVSLYIILPAISWATSKLKNITQLSFCFLALSFSITLSVLFQDFCLQLITSTQL